jgi:hypothetical protein
VGTAGGGGGRVERLLRVVFSRVKLGRASAMTSQPHRSYSWSRSGGIVTGDSCQELFLLPDLCPTSQ